MNPNVQSLQQWAEANEVAGDFDTLCKDSRARKYVLEELTKIGKEKKVGLFSSLHRHNLSSRHC